MGVTQKSAWAAVSGRARSTSITYGAARSPGPSSGAEPRYRLMVRTSWGIEHVSSGDYDLTGAVALYLLLYALGHQHGLTPEELGLRPEDIAAAATSKQ